MRGYNVYRDEYRRRAEELVSSMTLEEKVLQTLFTAPAIERLGIRSYNYWNEALHGVARAGTATVFPQAIGLAAAFDEDMMEQVGDIISTEARAKYNMQQKYDDHDIYKGLTFWSPNVNIFRDPRWGRGHETYGEDPYLTSRLGVRFIDGMQGHDDKFMKVAACAKHFAVHSGPEGIRHSFNAVISSQDLYETYLPAFRACVQEAEVEAVMGAYNRTNGEPCCGSKALLQDVLRKEWEFKGHVTSDCWAIKDFHENHKVTAGPVESAALAMKNGCDVNCGCLFAKLQQAVEDGMVSEERLTEAVVNLYTTRMKLGMYDETPFDAIGYEECDSPAHRAANLTVSKKTMTLLKNNGILPLKKESLKTIGVIGPNADSRNALVGNYEGTSSRYVTILEGIEDYVGDDVRVLYSSGCHLFKEKTENLGQPNDRISEVKGVCEHSDVVIVCIGLDQTLEGEEGDAGNNRASGDKLDLEFPGNQKAVLAAACESGKPVIVLSMCGSAMDLCYADKHAAAVLQTWYPGAQGGHAAAQILFGDASPEGKLPVTFYRTIDDLPAFTDYNMEGRTYRYLKKAPLYPFGYGLSYSKFEITDAKLSADTIAAGETIKASCTITNTGAAAGAETVQVYVKVNAEGTPHAQLKGLKKVFLTPGESREIVINLPAESFALYNDEPKLMLRKGTCTVYIGTAQPDERTFELTGVKAAACEVTCAEDAVLYDPKAEQERNA